MSLVSGEPFSAAARCAWHAWVRPGQGRDTPFADGPASRPRFEFGAHSAPARGRMRVRMTRGPKARCARAVNNASRRTAMGQKTSSERRGSRSQVALRPGRGLPRTGSPDKCVSVVKESHRRRDPVSRLPVLSNRRSRKTPKYRPSGRERPEYPKSADRRDRLYVWTERMREIRCGAADGPPTVSQASRRGNAAAEVRTVWSGLRLGNHMPKRPTPG